LRKTANSVKKQDCVISHLLHQLHCSAVINRKAAAVERWRFFGTWRCLLQITEVGFNNYFGINVTVTEVQVFTTPIIKRNTGYLV